MRNKDEDLRAKLLSFNSLCMCDSQSLGLKLGKEGLSGSSVGKDVKSKEREYLKYDGTSAAASYKFPKQEVGRDYFIRWPRGPGVSSRRARSSSLLLPTSVGPFYPFSLSMRCAIKSSSLGATGSASSIRSFAFGLEAIRIELKFGHQANVLR